jgi:hypothetical protein
MFGRLSGLAAGVDATVVSASSVVQPANSIATIDATTIRFFIYFPFGNQDFWNLPTGPATILATTTITGSKSIDQEGIELSKFRNLVFASKRLNR